MIFSDNVRLISSNKNKIKKKTRVKADEKPNAIINIVPHANIL